MEASQEQEPPPQHKLDRVLLSPETIEAHLQNGRPVSGEKAKMIWLMNKVIDKPETTDGGW